MPQDDPQELADQLEHETDRMQSESERLGREVTSAREDWERKRADSNVPGAPPSESPQSDEDQPESPAPQTPPPDEGTSAAEEASELEVGPSADPGAS